MQRDPQAEGLRWLEQAEADREGAHLLLEGGSYHLACFIAQHGAEKALKAFFYSQGEELVIGHSVEALCRWAARYDPEFEALRAEVAPLDAHYLPARYPNSVPDSIPARIYNRAMAVEAPRMADEVLNHVRRKLRGGPRAS